MSQPEHSNDVISIIMAAFNAEQYIEAAIQSVLDQAYDNFELLIVNDGSTDKTEMKVLSFQDSRIQYFRQSNKGVAAARNVALHNMRGNYFCFLDADDVMPKNSLSSRLVRFKMNPLIDFVDGRVIIYDEGLNLIKKKYQPDFNGNPINKLFVLSESCFFGPSWMIKRKENFPYRMQEGLSHGEDLLFYMSLSRKGAIYDYVTDEVLYYRSHDRSAMKNLNGLENGYKEIFCIINDWPELYPHSRITYQIKVKKIMFLSYFSQSEYIKAFKAVLS